MDNELTDRNFWIKYWENKRDLVTVIPSKNYFKPVFEKIYSQGRIDNSLEIGGFPGHYSVYLRKYYDIKPTLLDYVINEKVINNLLKANSLGSNEIQCIETDLFTAEPDSSFDFVFSFGFIEHFGNTIALIQHHLNYLKPGGNLLIVVPNFLGFNGWLNKKYDKEAYDTHYLACMEKLYLKECAQSCDLKEIETFYYGKFSIWLVNYATKNPLFKIMFKTIWLIGKVFTTIIPINIKQLSPYTILIAKKSL